MHITSYVFIYLAIWRAVKLGVFSNSKSTNLCRCSQSNNLLIYVYYEDSQLLFMSAWSQLCSHSHDRTTAALQNFLYIPCTIRNIIQHRDFLSYFLDEVKKPACQSNGIYKHLGTWEIYWYVPKSMSCTDSIRCR